MIHGLPDRYRFVTTVGTGGMGVVFKAIDTTLNRPVAIKALHTKLLHERPGARLRDEALAAAALDHPYICKVYELIESGEQTLIVMEFVEGETLAAKLERSRPPLEATLLIASEIAEGLADAHARGIVHRDIKPSNVMVTPHGHVKILDFGLAHSTDPDRSKATTHSGGPASRSGSPAYMSPEQARGREVGPASDLFSLGVVLYECLTGRLPFEGKTGYEYVGNVLSTEPIPLLSLVPDLPPPLVHLIEKCLQKDPDWRPESAAIVARELRMLLESGGRDQAEAAAQNSKRYQRAAAFVSLAIVVAALGFTLGPKYFDRGGPLDDPRETVPLVTWGGEDEDSRVSPDGKWISFVSNRQKPGQLFVRPIDGDEPRVVPVEGEVIAHTWAPDGRRLACYVVVNRSVYVQIVPAFGGGSVETSISLGERIDESARIARWIGDHLFVTSDSTRGSEGRLLARIDLVSGARENIKPAMEGPAQFQWFDVDPATSRIVFAALVNGQEDLWLANPDGSRPSRILRDEFFDRHPLWSGSLVTFQSNRGGQVDLWQVDPATGRVRLLSSSESDEVPEGASLDGRVITFQQKSANAKLWRLEPKRQPSPLTTDALSDFAPSASLDGRVLLFQRRDANPSHGATLFDSRIFMRRDNGIGVEAISPAASTGFLPRVSPGGNVVAYLSRPSAASPFVSLHLRDLATGETKTISSQGDLPGFTQVPAEWIHHNLAWSSSGFLFFIERGEPGSLIRRYDPRDGSILNVAGPVKTRITDVVPSPRGDELAYLLSHDGVVQLRRLSLASGAEHVIASWRARTAWLYLKGWTTDGELVVVRRHYDPAQADTTAMSVLAIGPRGERPLATVPGAHAVTARLSDDGSTLYYAGAEARILNVFALTLKTGAIQKLTSNNLESVSFSGILPLRDGTVIYSMDDRRQDIWLSRTVPQ